MTPQTHSDAIYNPPARLHKLGGGWYKCKPSRTHATRTVARGRTVGRGRPLASLVCLHQFVTAIETVCSKAVACGPSLWRHEKKEETEEKEEEEEEEEKEEEEEEEKEEEEE